MIHSPLPDGRPSVSPNSVSLCRVGLLPGVRCHPPRKSGIRREPLEPIGFLVHMQSSESDEHRSLATTGPGVRAISLLSYSIVDLPYATISTGSPMAGLD